MKSSTPPPSEKETKKTGIQHRIDETEKRFGVKLRSLADMEVLIDREVANFFKRGGVGLKSTSAYFRPLNFDSKVPRKDAGDLLPKGPWFSGLAHPPGGRPFHQRFLRSDGSMV